MHLPRETACRSRHEPPFPTRPRRAGVCPPIAQIHLPGTSSPKERDVTLVSNRRTPRFCSAECIARRRRNGGSQRWSPRCDRARNPRHPGCRPVAHQPQSGGRTGWRQSGNFPTAPTPSHGHPRTRSGFLPRRARASPGPSADGRWTGQSRDPRRSTLRPAHPSHHAPCSRRTQPTPQPEVLPLPACGGQISGCWRQSSNSVNGDLPMRQHLHSAPLLSSRLPPTPTDRALPDH